MEEYFMFQWGAVCFSDGGLFIFKWRGGGGGGSGPPPPRGTPWMGHWFWWERGFEKNREIVGHPPGSPPPSLPANMGNSVKLHTLASPQFKR